MDQGHTRIAYVGPKGNQSDFGPIPERWSAYKEIMRSKDLWDPDTLVFDPSLFKEWHVNASRIESIFRGKNAPTAVLGFDEVISLEVIRGLKSLNIQVPDQVSVIGHGDGLSACYSEPRLSTISPCLSEYVDTLIRALKTEIAISMSDGETLTADRDLVVPQRLLLRDSAKAMEKELTA